MLIKSKGPTKHSGAISAERMYSVFKKPDPQD